MAKMNPFFKKKYLKIGLIALLVTVIFSFIPRFGYGDNGIEALPEFGFPFVTRDNYAYYFRSYVYDYIVWFIIITLSVYLYEFDRFEVSIKKKIKN